MNMLVTLFVTQKARLKRNYHTRNFRKKSHLFILEIKIKTKILGKYHTWDFRKKNIWDFREKNHTQDFRKKNRDFFLKLLN